MAHGPENLVREPQVVFLIILPAHWDGGDGHIILDRAAHLDGSPLLGDVSIPAEPNAADRSKRVAERNRKPTRLDLGVEIGHAVRYNDETAQTNASQGLDSLVAPLIMPTIE